jgi:hypothetical protein
MPQPHMRFSQAPAQSRAPPYRLKTVNPDTEAWQPSRRSSGSALVAGSESRSACAPERRTVPGSLLFGLKLFPLPALLLDLTANPFRPRRSRPGCWVRRCGLNNKELDAVILGCAMPEEDRAAIAALVRSRFPHAEVLQARKHDMEFKLVFEKAS